MCSDCLVTAESVAKNAGRLSEKEMKQVEGILEEAKTGNTVKKGKNLSLSSKIIAVSFCIIATVLKGLKVLDLSVNDIVTVSAFIALSTSPIDISMIINNIKKVRQ